MAESISITISVLALVISGTTAWLTLFRRGTVRMTQPTVIFFGPDAPRTPDEEGSPKVYLRTLLFSTSKRGRVIESMHVTLSRNEAKQNFNIWVYGEHKLVRGSGLYVGENGISANHHFLTPDDDSESFRFRQGKYRLEVFAHILGDKKPKHLHFQDLEITAELASKLEDKGVGLYFDWGPDSEEYIPHVESRPPSPDLAEVSALLGLTSRSTGCADKPRSG